MKSNANLPILFLLSIVIFQSNSLLACLPSPTNHIKGVDELNPFICTCDQFYIFKPTLHACVRDCNLIAYAVQNCLQPQSNTDSCLCKQGYSWDLQNYLCGKNCKGVTNTNQKYDPLHINQCQCADPLTYEWSQKYQQCVRICTQSQITHKVSLDQTSPYTQCICQANYKYDTLTDTCNSMCGDDIHAHVIPGTTDCQCNTGYQLHLYSGDSKQKCGLICTTSLDTLGKDETNPNMCSCNSGFVWPDGKNYPSQTPYTQCILNCRSTTILSNTPNTNQATTKCNCNDGFQFILATSDGSTPAKYPGVCSRICTNIDYSTGKTDATDVSKCQCNTGYTWEYNGLYSGKCVRQCDKAASTDLSANGGWKKFDQCSCPSGFFYDIQQVPPICVRDCSKLAINDYSSGNLKSGSTTQCQCIDSTYTFITQVNSKFQNKCILNCPSINVYTTTNLDINTCNCIDGFQFISSTQGCGRICGSSSTLTNSIARASDNNFICTCDVGYHWSSQVLVKDVCVIDCSGVYTDVTHSSRLVCNCKDNVNYQWSAQLNTCIRKCQNIPNTVLNLSPTDINGCTCKKGFFWNVQSHTPYYSQFDSQCVKDCSTEVDPNSLGNAGIDKCQCNQFYTWESDTNSAYVDKCVRDCEKVVNSNTDYVHSQYGINKCDCLDNFIWNQVANTCDNPCGTDSVPNSNGVACYNPLKCTCADGYFWQEPTFKCIQCDATKWDKDNQVCLVDPGCGDGFTNLAQTCDDANTVDGDGCTNCQVDTNWVCTTDKKALPAISVPSVCYKYGCGDFATLNFNNVNFAYISNDDYSDRCLTDVADIYSIIHQCSYGDEAKWWIIPTDDGYSYYIQSYSTCKVLLDDKQGNTQSTSINTSNQYQRWIFNPPLNVNDATLKYSIQSKSSQQYESPIDEGDNVYPDLLDTVNSKWNILQFKPNP